MTVESYNDLTICIDLRSNLNQFEYYSNWLGCSSTSCSTCHPYFIGPWEVWVKRTLLKLLSYHCRYSSYVSRLKSKFSKTFCPFFTQLFERTSLNWKLEKKSYWYMILHSSGGNQCIRIRPSHDVNVPCNTICAIFPLVASKKRFLPVHTRKAKGFCTLIVQQPLQASVLRTNIHLLDRGAGTLKDIRHYQHHWNSL